jgi:ABC-type sugar transport system substrate-binding protein
MTTFRSIRMVLLLVALGWLLGCQSQAPSGSKPAEQPSGKADGKGVILLRYQPGSESTEQRERGFLETLQKEFPEIRVLSSDQYAGSTPEASLDKAQQMLLKYGDQVEGIFAVCESNADGVLGALEQAGLAGKVKFIGFDPNERMVAALAAGKMHGIVLQDPVKMGYTAVKTMAARLEGGEEAKIERRISTGEYVATPENMDTDEMRRLLNPPQLEGEETKGDKKYRIAVIPKGSTHEFWKSVHYGAQQAADELGNVEILWKGPQLESDRASQIALVEDFITKKVDGICLAPLDSQGLIPYVHAAKEAGIPTVIYDSDLDSPEDYVSYVATDNYQGGVLAARRLAEVLGKK